MRRNGQAQIIGTSLPVLDLKAEIERIARSDAKVLVTGESGTGKELVALGIHSASARADRPFVAVNCAGLPETLLESELFGHVKGSFTGAYRDKQGKLELADQGTVFLDEIGEMTLRMQGLLLRFLETGELQKVSADRAAGVVDVRVIAATNRHLPEMIAQGTFREDLYYRLNVIHLHVPPLRERKEDIPALAEHFLVQFTRQGGYAARALTPEALAALLEYPWPGNVRELKNAIEGAFLMASGPKIELGDFDWAAGVTETLRWNRFAYRDEGGSLKARVKEYERSVVQAAVNDSSTLQEAADRLKISRQSLNYKIKELGIVRPKRM